MSRPAPYPDSPLRASAQQRDPSASSRGKIRARACVFVVLREPCQQATELEVLRNLGLVAAVAAPV